MLTLRSSGDERVDGIRASILRSLSEHLATAAGSADDEQVLLRAQMVLAASLGMTLLRSAVPVRPINSAR
ncbi:hypothetical protein [Actinoplanes subtropicus]|uniref:hypothetical protein n=1 Tax=Actinoplanes subtropicus TaxID=543632 RepID=UPI0004C34EC2|nr:hypothetical protein [Actinoplanes subtropicus]